MSARREQILQQSVGLIAGEGYAAFSMRAVARASGMTLGSLQYHFPNRDALLRGIAAHVTQSYRHSFDAQHPTPDLKDVVSFVLLDAPGAALQADRLLPQLWAMALVEPVMEELLDGLYQQYVELLEGCLLARGAQAPHAEALAIMGLLEGQVLFVGRGRRWEASGPAVFQAVHALLDARYGEGSPQ